jgi:para-nitrobenzyl esterase
MRTLISVVVVLFGVLTAGLGSAQEATTSGPAPEARIAQGLVTGSRQAQVDSFLGLPFARPPVGPLRWKPPQPPEAWSGQRQATQYGAACPQPARSEGASGGVVTRQSEDCLTLNVWAPVNAESLPVMVWIHGGAHRIGSGVFPLYDGTNLAKRGVVMVTINYRLGYLGYFAHPALTAEASAEAPLGNYAMMDQLAALAWVQQNIAAFGGDPARVTVFGESAGGAAVINLMANPASAGLFAQAIVESGGGLANPTGLARQEQNGLALAGQVGLSANATVEELRAVPFERWIAATNLQSGGGFGPFVDGRLITEAPWRAFAAGRAVDVPLLIGANSDEASVMQALGVPLEAAAGFVASNPEAARRAYGASRITPETYARQVLGDAWFVAPARWIAGAAAGGAPSYLYHFSYVAERRRGQTPGAAHGSEIPYVFNNWDKLPALSPFVTANDQAMADRMSECWVSFAVQGRPSCADAEGWPAYSPETDTLVDFGPEVVIRPAFRKAQLDLLLGQFFRNQGMPELAPR